MRILLPPSEGKTPPTSGPPLSVADLSFPQLNPVRNEILAHLTEGCRTQPQLMAEALRLGPRQAAEVARNAALLGASTAPAHRLYTGVLYDALDPATLPPTTIRHGDVLIASALFGLIGWRDRIPAYRLPGTARIPGLPSLRRLWSRPLGGVLTELAQQELVVDMRSGTYASWSPPHREHWGHERWVTVRVVADREGRRVSVSHHNKATKGRLARHLLASGSSAATAAELLPTLRDAGWAAKLHDGVLEVVLRP